MDKWIQLGVIEPSRSPWAAPAFIVYQNEKPRMVIDYRRLNDMVISDEFPLPGGYSTSSRRKPMAVYSRCISRIYSTRSRTEGSREISLPNSPRLLALCPNAFWLQERTKH